MKTPVTFYSDETDKVSIVKFVLELRRHEQGGTIPTVGVFSLFNWAPKAYLCTT